jgi:hypothetical protein
LTSTGKHGRKAPSTSLAWSFEMALRAADNAVASATRGYEFSPGSYTSEALDDALIMRGIVLELPRKAGELLP